MAHTRHILLSRARYRYCEGDRGSRVTLIGLAANILLTSAKGAAGWYMNSAALLADAGHSLSGKHALQPPTSLSFLSPPAPISRTRGGRKSHRS